MCAKKKTVRKAFSYRNCDDFAAYLNHMARLGWHFKEFRSKLVFEKGEPEDAVYAVEIFTDGTAHDMQPSYKAKNFAEYCEAAGWQLIDQRVKWCVLKRTRENAVPIFTDEERFENVKSVTYSGPGKFLWTELLILALMFGMNLYNPKVYLFTMSQILWSVYWPMVFLRDLYQTIEYRRWCKNCEARIDRGEPLHLRKQSNTALMWVLASIPLLISAGYVLNFDFFSIKLVWILAGVFLFVTFLWCYLPSRFRLDTDFCQLLNILYWSFFVMFMISVLIIASNHDMAKPEPNPPVSIDIFQPGQEAADIELSRDTTPFGSKLSCHLYTENGKVSYFIYESQHEWVLDVVWNQELRNSEIQEYCTDDWDTLDAFRTAKGRYVIRCEDRILILKPGQESLNQEQIDIIVAALKGG